MPKWFFQKIIKKYAANFFRKKPVFAALCCKTRFLTNLKRGFPILDIFLFFKNVQNQNRPMNLAKGVFWPSY